jgi:hypothetical protein
MKNTFCFTFFCLLAGACLLPMLDGCTKKPTTRTYSILTPLYAGKASVLASINGSAGQPVDSAGKIYLFGNYIFLNELNKGIHIFDNTDPSHPEPIAFLSVPGCQNIAVKGNTLYADMYQDLLAIDISNPRQVKITGTVAGLFSSREVVNGFLTNTASQVITGWVKKDTTVSIDPVLSYQRPRAGCRNCLLYSTPSSGNLSFASAAANASSSATGTAGSMASMVLINNYLYAISESHSLGIVDLTDAANLSLKLELFAGYDLETIYPFQDKLFLGSMEGVFIYDLSNPAKPQLSGTFAHGRACDPVVADSNYAYVTLHAGTACGGASNELDVLDVHDPAQARLLRSYPMTSPMGLCTDGNLLFVCDGSSGVKVYNAKDPANLQLLTATGGGQAYDVIAANRRLLAVAADGLYQYDYSNPSNLRLLSFLPAK